MILFIPTLIFFTTLAWGQSGPNLCDILDIKNCPGITKQGRRTSLLSLPSPATAAITNPATVSFDRGFGIEAIYQGGNPILFSLASGTGRMGGTLISSSLENTFFGNRVVELNDDFLERNQNKKQYKTNKLNAAFGGKLFRRKHFSLDLGVSLKRHNEIKKINPGVGISGRLGPLTYGASIYKDDFYLDFTNRTNPVNGIPYSIFYGKDNYSESFTVTTYSLGTKFKSFAFDAGIIKTSYELDDNDSDIKLFSGSYIFRNFMINLAYRVEKSFAPLFKNDALEFEEKKNYIYSGLQVSLGKHFITGINYNYFLLNEFSLSGTLFF